MNAFFFLLFFFLFFFFFKQILLVFYKHILEIILGKYFSLQHVNFSFTCFIVIRIYILIILLFLTKSIVTLLLYSTMVCTHPPRAERKIQFCNSLYSQEFKKLECPVKCTIIRERDRKVMENK